MNDRQRVINRGKKVLLFFIIIHIFCIVYLFVDFNLFTFLLEFVMAVTNFYILTDFLSLYKIKYKKFDIDGNIVEIYAGLHKQYIKVNGEIKAQHRSIFKVFDVKMSCIVNLKVIEVIITPSNYLAVKLDGKLIG